MRRDALKLDHARYMPMARFHLSFAQVCVTNAERSLM
jgi:hypothetical protein